MSSLISLSMDCVHVESDFFSVVCELLGELPITPLAGVRLELTTFSSFLSYIVNNNNNNKIKIVQHCDLKGDWCGYGEVLVL